MELDKDVPLPLYYQIKQILRQNILDGNLKPGDMVPPERELAEVYQVSRMTTRQAINELVREGLVKREQGKGTYVCPKRVKKEVAKFTSFSEDMRARGMTPSSRLITFSREPAGKIGPQLRLRADDEVYQIFRLRYADLQPMAYERAYLPCKLFPDLHLHNLEQHSLYEIVQKHYIAVPAYAEQTIQVAKLTTQETNLLGLKKGDSGLETSRTVFNLQGELTEFTVSIYHPHRYQYEVKLYP